MCQACPLGGGWHGEAVTDEGAMIELLFVGPDARIGPLDGSFRRGISPPAGGEFLCPWRQRNQNATRDGSDARVTLSCAFPRTPLTVATTDTNVSHDVNARAYAQCVSCFSRSS